MIRQAQLSSRNLLQALNASASCMKCLMRVQSPSQIAYLSNTSILGFYVDTHHPHVPVVPAPEHSANLVEAGFLSGTMTTPVVTQDSISEQLDGVLHTFEELRREEDAVQSIRRDIVDSMARIRIWAGNVGAFHSQNDSRSAERRLRLVPMVSKRIGELLRGIQSDCQDLLSLLRDEHTDASQQSAVADLDQYDADLLDDDPHDARSEATEIMSCVVDSISSLFKVSVLLQRATPRDRYARAKATASPALFSALSRYDIRHVAEKYPKVKADNALEELLGKAITERRLFLSYAKDHHKRISDARPAQAEAVHPNVGIMEHSGGSGSVTVSEKPSRLATDASTVHPVLGTFLLQETVQKVNLIEDDDDGYSQATSQTSFKDQGYQNGRLRVIPLQDVCEDEHPFECPYCWQIVAFKRQSSWVKHVMRDLRAYACTFATCTAGLFEHREDWFKHELEVHRRIWVCPSCTESNTSYHSATSLQQHLQEVHPAFAEDLDDQNSILDTCSRPIAHMPADSACPLCDDYERGNETQSASTPVITMRNIKKHLADHQEQLALFAMPRVEDDGDAVSDQGVIGKDSLLGQPESSLGHTSSSRSTSSASAGETTSYSSAIGVHSEAGSHETRHDENDGFTAEAGQRHSNHSEDDDETRELRLVSQVTEDCSDSDHSRDDDEVVEVREEHSSGSDVASKDSGPQSSSVDAIKAMQKQVIRLEVALGRDHPKTLDSTSHLALIYRDASKWLGAEELQLEVLERRERTLGEMHPHTLDSLSALASTFMATGRLDEAVKLHRKLIDKARYLLGEEHHITLERMKDLAYMLQSRGLYEEALDMEGQVRTAIVREFGTASPDAIESMHRTSAILHRMGRKDDAFALMSESAKLSPRDPGPDHHSLAQRGIDLTETWTRKDMKPTVESRVGRKGETLLPKTVVHRDALNELAYEYDERKDFFILQIALGKDQVDEVIRLSEDVLKLSEMYNARDNVLAPKRLDHEDTSDDDERDEYDVEMRWRRGKTRMPKRLVHRDALHDLAYRYDEEEEEDFFVLPFALNREEIDEVIKISKVYKKDERSVEIDGWTATDPDSCKNTNDEAGGSVNTIGS